MIVHTIYNGYHDDCLNHFFTIQDFITHPESSLLEASLLEILWTGDLHSDQQFGPTFVMESATILLEASKFELNPNLNNIPKNKHHQPCLWVCEVEVEVEVEEANTWQLDLL